MVKSLYHHITCVYKRETKGLDLDIDRLVRYNIRISKGEGKKIVDMTIP